MNWHNRYQLQAGWTRELRTYLFHNAGLSDAHRVLEVGCGTGAILSELTDPDFGSYTSAELYGIDLSTTALAECRSHSGNSRLTCGDAQALPYPERSFDITFCHFLLLWVSDPLQALREMKRVTRVQGHILAMAEPDYTARLDRPPELSRLGTRQNESLTSQGADISLGSHLADLFYQAGITIRETGAIQNRGSRPLPAGEWENEWAILQADLSGIVAREELRQVKHLDEQAWKAGQHEITVPTYFAWGQV